MRDQTSQANKPSHVLGSLYSDGHTSPEHSAPVAPCFIPCGGGEPSSIRINHNLALNPIQQIETPMNPGLPIWKLRYYTETIEFTSWGKLFIRFIST